MPSDIMAVSCLRCGCGHWVTGLDMDRVKAMMLDHLIHSHGNQVHA